MPALPVVIDTDFTAGSPSDDALAVLLALRSPELDVVAITTVMGNDTLERATSDVLRVLEIAGRPEVPVHAGARVNMFDEVAVASLVDPSLLRTRDLYVDVDDRPGINYGVSVGGEEPWPGAEGARRISVQHELDWERFARLFVQRLTSR